MKLLAASSVGFAAMFHSAQTVQNKHTLQVRQAKRPPAESFNLRFGAADPGLQAALVKLGDWLETNKGNTSADESVAVKLAQAVLEALPGVRMSEKLGKPLRAPGSRLFDGLPILQVLVAAERKKVAWNVVRACLIAESERKEEEPLIWGHTRAASESLPFRGYADGVLDHVHMRNLFPEESFIRVALVQAHETVLIADPYSFSQRRLEELSRDPDPYVVMRAVQAYGTILAAHLSQGWVVPWAKRRLTELSQDPRDFVRFSAVRAYETVLIQAYETMLACDPILGWAQAELDDLLRDQCEEVRRRSVKAYEAIRDAHPTLNDA